MLSETAWRARAIAASSRAISAEARSGWPAISPIWRIWAFTSSRFRGTENSATRSPCAFSNSRVARLSKELATTTSGFSTSTSSAPPDRLA